MDIVEIIFISAIVSPMVLTAAVMIFVWRSIKKREAQEKEQREKDKQQGELIELVEILEGVVESQDRVLGGYRKMM